MRPSPVVPRWPPRLKDTFRKEVEEEEKDNEEEGEGVKQKQVKIM
jgi:hypothetical protein